MILWLKLRIHQTRKDMTAISKKIAEDLIRLRKQKDTRKGWKSLLPEGKPEKLIHTLQTHTRMERINTKKKKEKDKGKT